MNCDINNTSGMTLQIRNKIQDRVHESLVCALFYYLERISRFVLYRFGFIVNHIHSAPVIYLNHVILSVLRMRSNNIMPGSSLISIDKAADPPPSSPTIFYVIHNRNHLIYTTKFHSVAQTTFEIRKNTERIHESL